MASEVQLDLSDGVAVLTLNAPERRNALTVEMAKEIVDRCDEIDQNTEVGGVVVTGAGSTFCAGAHRDLLQHVALDPAGGQEFAAIGAIYESFLRVGRLKPPTIAAISGAAVGAGVNLALATDLRVMAKDARLTSGFLAIDVHPGGGHFALLSQHGGREAAAALGLFSQTIDGTEAVERGLAWESLSEPEVLPRAIEIAASVASVPSLAREAAQSFRLEASGLGMPWDVATSLERAPQMWSFRRGSMRPNDDH